MTSDRLVFRVREKGDAHASAEVVATGSGKDFWMTCTCLASLHGAPLCPHIVAVLREREDRVMSGKRHFAALRTRAKGSRVADKGNGYWHFYPEDEF